MAAEAMERWGDIVCACVCVYVCVCDEGEGERGGEGQEEEERLFAGFPSCCCRAFQPFCFTLSPACASVCALCVHG